MPPPPVKVECVRQHEGRFSVTGVAGKIPWHHVARYHSLRRHRFSARCPRLAPLLCQCAQAERRARYHPLLLLEAMLTIACCLSWYWLKIRPSQIRVPVSRGTFMPCHPLRGMKSKQSLTSAGVIMFPVSIRQPLTLLSCSCTSAGAHKHSDSASSPSPCPSRCNPHPHRHVYAHRGSLCARVRQPSSPCSDPAHCRCRCRYHSKSWTNPSPNRRARAACGRCSTLCCSSCPCPRCRRRLRPSGCLCVLPVLLLAGGGYRWGCWGRRWFGGLFGCRGWLWVLRFRSPGGGFAGGVALSRVCQW